MFDTIHEGEMVLIWKPIKFLASFQKNQVVLFQREENEITTSFVKRVAAVPGDSISANTKEMLIDKSKYPHDEVYNLITDSFEDDNKEYFKYLLQQPGKCGKKKSLEDETLYDSTKLKVPSSCYFMIGDNPYESMDSRFWGFIHESQIVGKVVATF